MQHLLAKLALAAVLLFVSGQVSALIPFRLIELQGQKLKWGNAVLGTPAKVTVGFVQDVVNTPKARNCKRMQPMTPLLHRAKVSPLQFLVEVKAALRAWERAAGIEFVITEDPDSADILIGAQVRPRGRAFANVTPKRGMNGPVAALSRSHICLNPAWRWKVGFDGRLDAYDLRYTITHEIGHAIGLNHAGPAGQLMSFKYEEAFRELQAGDIAGAVTLYGRPIGRTN